MVFSKISTITYDFSFDLGNNKLPGLMKRQP
jgi:hypothetical protein